MMKKIFLFAFLLLGTKTFAQTDDNAGSLLDLLSSEEKAEKVTNAFKSPRVINTHSMEMLHAGTLDFRILHRFGLLNSGYKELFGLDNATMRLGFDYGITNNLMVGVGRSTLKKELDGYAKYRILWQEKGGKNPMPVSVAWVSGMTYNTLDNPFSQPDVKATFSRRSAYYHQLVIGRKFNDHFSLQVAPTLVHTNLVANEVTPNNLWAMEIGGRYKFSQRVAFVWDYSLAFNRFPSIMGYNPLSLGFDIETGGHIFQLHFSNSNGLNERAFIADKSNKWGKGQVRFGFNLSRVFQVKKNKI